MLEGEGVVPDHGRRVAVGILHGGVVGQGPGGVIIDIPGDVKVESLVDAGEVRDVRLGAVPVGSQIGAVRVAVPNQVVETVCESHVQVVGAAILVLAPPPQHVGCDVEVSDAAVTVGGTLDSRVASTGGKSAAVGYFFLDVSSVCLVDDGLDVEIGRGAAIRRTVEFAVRNIRGRRRPRRRSRRVRAEVEKRGWRGSTRRDCVRVSVETGAEVSDAEVGFRAGWKVVVMDMLVTGSGRGGLT